MTLLLPRMRRAALPMFASHALSTALALALATALYASSPDAFAAAARPLSRDDLAELARALHRLVAYSYAMGTPWLALLGFRWLLSLLEGAFWLEAMAGRAALASARQPTRAALNAALCLQPRLWELAIVHLFAQGLWAGVLLLGAPALANAVERSVGIIAADITRAGLSVGWALGALSLTSARDLAAAHVVLGELRLLPALRARSHIGLLRATLLKAACGTGAALVWIVAALLTALAFPDAAPLGLLLLQQLASALGCLARGTWVAVTAGAAERHGS